jgi:hypothetical protein
MAVTVLEIQLYRLALPFEDPVRPAPAFMGEAEQPGRAAGIIEADAARVRPYRREKLRAFGHDAF